MNSTRMQEYMYMKGILNSISKELGNLKLLSEKNTISLEENMFIKLINKIEKEVSTNKISIEELKSPFLLFIVGSGNYGKSTVINSLLKDKIVETTDLPNTWKVDLFISSCNEKMEIVYNSGLKKICKIDKGIVILKNEEVKLKDSKKRISKEIKKIKNSGNYNKDTLKKIKNDLENKHLYKSEIAEVHYYLKDIGILNDFIIVDTPGLNQNLLKNTKDIMNYYYKRADGVIWLIDAQNIVAKENNQLIKEISEINSINIHKKNIIGVVNKIDIIEKYSDENINKVKSKVANLYDEIFNDIVYISAKEAMEGILKSNEKLIYKSNIKSLYESIENNFKILSEENQIKSKYVNLKIMKNNILTEVEIYKRQLYKDIFKYSEAKHELKEKTLKLENNISEKLNYLKKRSYIESDFNLINLNSEIKDIEVICNKEIEKIYNSLALTSNISNNKDFIKESLKLSFTKSKYLINNYYKKDETITINLNAINKKFNFNNFTYRNSKENTQDKYLIKEIINKKIEELTREILNQVDEKVYTIKQEINNLREFGFKESHINYRDVDKLVFYLNNIEDILNNMGGYYGR